MNINTRGPSKTDDSFSTLAMIEGTLSAQERPSRLNWWYRIAAPPVPAATASLKEREGYRRGKYISNTLLAMCIVLATLIILVGGFVNHALLPNLGVTFLVIATAVFFNRRGQIIVSGILVVLVLDASLMTSFLAFGTLKPYLLPGFDLLVIPELFAASLLPPVFVFFDMSFHLVFVVAALTFLFPPDSQLAALVHNSATFGDILARPTVIQVVAAVIAYTWMRSVTASVERADRATSIALLEKSVAEQSQLEAEQKRQLESEIQEIIEVHRQVANGNFDARVRLGQGNKLWSVAGSLNNLIARFQNLLRESQRSHHTDEAIARFFHVRNQVQNGPIPWQPTGTPVDVLVRQHNTFARPSGEKENQLL